jgi:hypothetical protein
MLLGFIISKHGIEANPEKITAITKMGPIRDLKGVQRVTGCWQPSVASFRASAKKRYLCIVS